MKWIVYAVLLVVAWTLGKLIALKMEADGMFERLAALPPTVLLLHFFQVIALMALAATAMRVWRLIVPGKR